jgi:hypothetical protein
MPRSTAEELTIESRRSLVADLFLRDIKRQAELTQLVGVNRSTISRDLRVLNPDHRRQRPNASPARPDAGDPRRIGLRPLA